MNIPRRFSRSKFLRLMIKLFERHGLQGTNTLQNIIPYKNGEFKTGYVEYRLIKNNIPIIMYYLHYQEKMDFGITSRAVRIREVIR